MAKIVDNINLLPNPYQGEEYILILRVTEKEMEEDFPEIIQIKELKRERRTRKNKTHPHSKITSQFKY